MNQIILKFPVSCISCERPTNKFYRCQECGVDVCPSCVCSDQGLGIKPLCPDCPGAAIKIEIKRAA